MENTRRGAMGGGREGEVGGVVGDQKQGKVVEVGVCLRREVGLAGQKIQPVSSSCVQRPGEQSCVQLSPLFCLVCFFFTPAASPFPRRHSCVCFINGEMDKRSPSGRNEFSFRSS